MNAMLNSSQRKTRRRRCGAAAIEFAMVLPVFLMFVTFLYEYAHAQMVLNLLRSSCRVAARFGSIEGVTSEQALARAQAIVNAGVPAGFVTLSVKDASVFDTDGPYPEDNEDYEALDDLELSSAESRQMFVVRAQVNYDSIAILNLPFFGNLTLTGQAVMRHE